MSSRRAQVSHRPRRDTIQSTNWRRRWLGIEFLEDRRLLATRVLDFNALPGNANVGTQVSEDGFLVQSISSVLATRGNGYAFTAAQGVTLYNGTIGGDTRIVRQDGGNFKLTSLQLNSLNSFASAFVPFTAFPSAGGSSNFSLTTDGNFNAFQTFASPTSVNLTSLVWDQVNNAGDYHQFDNVTLEIGPVITSVGNVSPDPTTTALSTLDVTFDTTVDLATFTFADVSLTRNGTPVPLTSAVTISLASGTTYTINGLSSFTALGGNYVLTVNALNIRNAADLQGMGTATESWTMDAAPQVASTTPSLTSSGVVSAGATSLQVQFNEPVTGANNAANYELQRAGTDGLLGNADDQLVLITSATYASETNTATLNVAGLVEDTYRLIVKDGITDATGNALDGDANGVAGGNWQRDLVAGSFGLSNNPPTVIFQPSTPAPAHPDSVAIDGNLRVVGAVSTNVGGLNFVGSAAVYDGNGGLVTTLANPTPAANDRFGVSVAISGNLVVVGAYLDDTTGTDSGAAYVFNATTGTLVASLANPSPGTNDYFGLSVSISGSTVVVGAYGDDTGAVDSGRAYVFNAITGALVATLANPSPAAGDAFGYSVSVSGNLVAAGADRDDTFGLDAGIAYLFNASTGALVSTLPNPTPTANHDAFGRSLSIAGNTVVVGAELDNTVVANNGTAYLFNATTGALMATLVNPTPAVNDNFSRNVSIGERYVVVSSHTDDNSFGTDVGSVYLFGLSGTLLATIANPTPAQADYFGNSVAQSGSKILIAAFGDDTQGLDRGASYIFTYEPIQSLTAPNVIQFDLTAGGSNAGQLLQGTSNSFDGLNRLRVADASFEPVVNSGNTLQDNGRTVVTPAVVLSNLSVSREITVPSTGSQSFARTIDVFTNTTGSPISVPVRITGNLGSDAATTVFATSDGDTLVEPTDTWFGTDDADGTGTPAIIHLLHGPLGIQPASMSVIGDNIDWTYNITVPAGVTQRPAHFTILGTTRAGAVAAVSTLLTPNGFGDDAAAFLTTQELESIANFEQLLTVTDASFLTAGTLSTNATSLTVNFREPILGGTTASNYELRRSGADGLLGNADDVIIAIPSVTMVGNVATLNFAALPEDIYRLTIKDSITDGNGNALDGDANGVAGGNWQRDLVVIDSVEYLATPGIGTQTLIVSADAGLRGDNRNSPEGGDDKLVLNENQLSYTLLKFDLSNVSRFVKKATVRMEWHTSTVAAQGVGMYVFGNPWNENTVTWNNANGGSDPFAAVTSGVISSVDSINLGPGTQTGTFADWDVTSVVRQWTQGTLVNNGLLMRTAAGHVSLAFHSKEGHFAPQVILELADVDIDSQGAGSGQLVHGRVGSFDGLNRLSVAGANFAPSSAISAIIEDAGKTVTTATASIAGLNITREITVPAAGPQAFVRTVNVLTNPSESAITVPVRTFGNLGSDAATAVFATSDGDTLVEPTDWWFGTDDADGSGTPALVHMLYGPHGLKPSSVSVLQDNVDWTFDLTIPAGTTRRLANFTVLGTTRADAMAAANALVTSNGFAGEAATFMTAGELATLVNFQVNVAPTDVAMSSSTIAENQPTGSTVGIFASTDTNLAETFTYSLVSGTGDTDNAHFTILGDSLRTVGPFNFEAKSNYAIRVRTTDAGGLMFEKAFTINVLDLEEIPPTVSNTSFLASGTLPAGATSLAVVFSEPVLGGTLASNYELRRSGLDGLLGNADDPIISLSTISLAGNTATLNFAELSEDVYRLVVKDAVTDAAGNALDGDGNGSTNGNWLRDFVVKDLSLSLIAPSGSPFDIQLGQTGYGQLIHGSQNAFDGLNRLSVNGQNYSPPTVRAPQIEQSEAATTSSAALTGAYADVPGLSTTIQVTGNTPVRMNALLNFASSSNAQWDGQVRFAINGVAEALANEFHSTFPFAATLSGTTGSGGDHVHNYGGTTSFALGGTSSHNHSFSGTTGNSGSHTHSVLLSTGTNLRAVGVSAEDWITLSPGTYTITVQVNGPNTVNYQGKQSLQVAEFLPSPLGEPAVDFSEATTTSIAALTGAYADVPGLSTTIQVTGNTPVRMNALLNFASSSNAQWDGQVRFAINGVAEALANEFHSTFPFAATLSGTTGSGGDHVHNYGGTTSFALGGASSHNHNFSGTTSNSGSHTHSVLLSTGTNLRAVGVTAEDWITLSPGTYTITVQVNGPNTVNYQGKQSLQVAEFLPSPLGEPAVDFSEATTTSIAALTGAYADVPGLSTTIQVTGNTPVRMNALLNFASSSNAQWDGQVRFAINGVAEALANEFHSTFPFAATLSGTTGSGGDHVHNYGGTTSFALGGASSHNHSFSGTTSNSGSHTHSVLLSTGTNLRAVGVSAEDWITLAPGIYTITVQVNGPNTVNFVGMQSLRTAEFPALVTIPLDDGGRTIPIMSHSLSGLDVSREITVPAIGTQSFARIIDVFSNPTASSISVPIRIRGNLGSDAATTVFATSDGDLTIESTDIWFGTDDADGTGTPAIIHLLHGPFGLQPTNVNILEDNLEWTYNLLVPAGQTQRLAAFTILGTTQADAINALNALINMNGFTGQAATFLSSAEQQSLANFQFNTAPTDIAISQSSINENSPVGATIGSMTTTDGNSVDNFTYSFVSGAGDADNNSFAIIGNQLRTATGLNFEGKSNYSVRIKSTDQGGLTFEKILSISVIDLPELAGAAVIGDGTTQRSLVREMVVTFEGVVDIALGAFIVDKLGSNGGAVPTSAAAVLNGSGQTVVTLTFSGSHTRGTQGALTDGFYRLTIDASKITRAGRALDANSDGVSGDNYVIGAAEADNFFALFGDTNGDGLVSVAEFGQFRTSFGKTIANPGYNSLYDYDGDGAVGVADFGQFRSRFGKPKLTM